MRPTISIIIPVYNVQDYLTSCIESIIKQDYKDYEAIFINDGSTDDSLEILKQYVKTDKRFKLISQKNSGLSSARNTGINQAKGKYITFIDSDDWISKNYVGALVYNAEKYDADIVSIKECLVYSNGKKVYKTYILVGSVEFLDTKKKEDKAEEKQEVVNNTDIFQEFANEVEIDPMSLPF